MSTSRPESPASRWKEVQRLFHAALALPEAQRSAWLARAAHDDAPLRAEVEALLAADAAPASLLDEPPARLLGTADRVGGADPLAPGGCVGPYRVARVVGRGGMGVVFLAHDERTGEPVALKVLRGTVAEALAPAESRRRFLREIRVGTRLTHPGLVPVLDSGDTDGRLWFVMPFVEGETLRDRLRRDRRLPLDVVATIGRRLAEALAWLADAGIAHRDVKPDNVLLAHDDAPGTRALLADFGVARALDLADVDGRVTASGVLVGTLRYMSPEQVRGEPVTAATDVFALGAVLHEMLAGEPPYRGAAQRALLRADASAPLPDVRGVRDDVPPTIAATIGRALAADAHARPTSAEIARVLAAG